MPSHLISAWNCLAQRSPVFATCQPTTSEAQWSTAAKTQHQPSAFVQNRDASVPPELVRPVGPDPAAVGPVPAGMPPPHRCQQPVLLHQPQHPVLTRPDPLGREPRLHLAVALAEERTRFHHRPGLFHQLLVAQCRLRAPLPGLSAIGLRRPALLRSQHNTRSSVRPSTSRTPSSADQENRGHYTIDTCSAWPRSSQAKPQSDRKTT